MIAVARASRHGHIFFLSPAMMRTIWSGLSWRLIAALTCSTVSAWIAALCWVQNSSVRPVNDEGVARQVALELGEQAGLGGRELVGGDAAGDQLVDLLDHRRHAL